LKRPLSLVLVILIGLANVFGDVPAGKFSDIDAMYFWFCSSQNDKGLVMSENKDNFTVEEEAAAVLVFLKRGHFHRAERILEFFQDLQKESSKTGDFKGFYRYYQFNGQPLSSEILTATQLWLLLAVNEYSLATGDDKFIPFAQSLAKIVLGMEGLEHGIAAGYWEATPLVYFTAADNLLAVSVFPKLWKLSEQSEYRFAAWRTHQFLNRFLWNEEHKNFRRRIYKTEFDITDSLWATLVYGAKYQGWISFSAPTDLYNQILFALMYSSVYHQDDKSKEILKEAKKNIIWSKKYSGTAGLPVVAGGNEIDISVTAWFLIALKKYNPFRVDTNFWENKVMLPPSERQFKGDDFEGGLLKTLLTYSPELFEEKHCRINIDIEKEDVKAGVGALHIYFVPDEKAVNPSAVITREFVEWQDFSTFSMLKVWLKATTNTRVLSYGLKMNIGLVDSDGELWLSPDLSITGRKGFINSLSFPNGWTRDPQSKGNGIFDVQRISKMKIILSETNDTPWHIFMDDLIMQ
jgi:hypothetical protein